MNAKILLVVVVLASSSCLQQPETLCVAVYDGDTFELDNETIVRLAGVDAPEYSEPGGDTAQDYLSQLILNKEVILLAGPEDKDEYGRLLKYVYVDNICVNEEMVRNGYAEARYLPENDSNCEYYIQLEMEAEHNKAGLWELGIFQPRLNLGWESDAPVPVITWKDVHRYYRQYVIVEGVVVDTYNSGKVCFLHFHKDHKQFTAVIFACDFPGFPKSPEVYYLGKKVQIIGIIKEYKSTPEMIVKTPGQIKIIE